MLTIGLAVLAVNIFFIAFGIAKNKGRINYNDVKRFKRIGKIYIDRTIKTKVNWN